MKKKKPKAMIVQVKNPKTKRYVKIDKRSHRIVGTSITPFEGVPIVRRKKKK